MCNFCSTFAPEKIITHMSMKRTIWIALLLAAVRIGLHASEHVICYPSVNQFGGPLTLSGRLTVPDSTTAKGIILLLHGTYTSNNEVPSNKPMMEEKWFGADYVMVMPDYMGYGITQDSIHPYLCGELTAQHCVDMLLHIRTMLDTMQVQTRTDSITIIGFSQGGATALWTFKLLEEHYAERLPVKACYAGSGPYDVASEFDVSVQNNKTGMPVTVPMLVLGTNLAYDLHLNTDDFFTYSAKSIMKQFVTRKKYGFVDVWFRTPVHQLNYWLNKNGRDKSQPATQRIYEGLLRSSLVHYPVDCHPVGQRVICPSWRPKAYTYVFHSTNDNIVGFHNADHLRRCWGEPDNVQYEFGKFGNHLQSYRLFIKHVCSALLPNP